MKKFSEIVALPVFAAAMVFGTGGAGAVPTLFGGNAYEFVQMVNISWQDARNAAASSSFGGVVGHVATVTSVGENDFLQGLISFGSFAGSWLGGDVNASFQGIWREGPEIGLQFSLGGAAFGGQYANWGGIEPNIVPSAVYMNVGTLTSGIQNGQWVDAVGGLAGGGDPIQGYFIEYENPVTVSEPGTLAIFGLGLAGLGLMRRRRTA